MPRDLFEGIEEFDLDNLKRLLGRTDVTETRGEPRCFRCCKKASELLNSAFLQDYYGEGGHKPEEFVRKEDGTYNSETNTFACDACYIAIGCPTAPGQGWKAPAIGSV